ncbi:MAG: O-antigen ligase family protein [Sedimentibacter sp.]|uniref:O-antigen ligase family protein n=1 Tax=Sedimentibacter sp. TaxID=1960295 RepID=UPI003158E9B5
MKKDKIGIKKLEQESMQADKFQNIVRITLLLVLAGIPLVFVPLDISQGNFDQFFLPKVIVMFLLVLSSSIMFMLHYKEIESFIEKDTTNKALLVYYGLLVLSLFFTDNISISVFGRPDRSEGLVTISMYLILFFMGRYIKDINYNFFKFVMATAVIVAIYGILQYFGIDPFPRNYRSINYGRSAFSTMGNPNFLGSYLVLMIPVSLYFYIFEKRKSGFLSYVVLFFCLLCTRTRGAWLGTILSISCLVYLHFFYHKNIKNYIKRYITLIIISLIVILVFDFFSEGVLINRFTSISSDMMEFLKNGENSDYAGSHRGFIWKRVIQLIKYRPLTGYGIENLGETFLRYFKDDMFEFWGEIRYVDKAHNDFLNIAVTTGVPSLIVYLIFVLSVLKKGLSNAKNPVLLILLPSISGYLAAIFFNISVTSVAYVYWVFLGMAASNNLKI